MVWGCFLWKLVRKWLLWKQETSGRFGGVVVKGLTNSNYLAVVGPWFSHEVLCGWDSLQWKGVSWAPCSKTKLVYWLAMTCCWSTAVVWKYCNYFYVYLIYVMYVFFFRVTVCFPLAILIQRSYSRRAYSPIRASGCIFGGQDVSQKLGFHQTWRPPAGTPNEKKQDSMKHREDTLETRSLTFPVQDWKIYTWKLRIVNKKKF